MDEHKYYIMSQITQIDTDFEKMMKTNWNSVWWNIKSV